MKNSFITALSTISLLNFILCIQHSAAHFAIVGPSNRGHGQTRVLHAHQQFYNNHTAKVETALELSEALRDSNKSLIIVAKNMMLSWYNGWGAGLSIHTHGIDRTTDVTISSVPGSVDRAVVDIDGLPLFGSLFRLNGINLTISRLFLKNVPGVQPEVLGDNLDGSQVNIEDSIIQFRGAKQMLIVTLVQGQPDSTISTQYAPGFCEIDNQKVECTDGGVMVKTLKQSVPSMRTTGRVEFSNTLFMFEVHRPQPVMDPSLLGKYMEENEKSDLVLNSPETSIDMVEATSCKTDSPVYVGDNILVDGTNEPVPAIFLECHQVSECLTVGQGAAIRFKRIFLRECAAQGHFMSNFLPFFKMEQDSIITLDGVLISVVPKSHSSSLKDIKREFRHAALHGDKLNLTDISVKEFYLNPDMMLQGIPETIGFLVEDAVIPGKSGSEVHLVHSLMVVDDYKQDGRIVAIVVGSVSACIAATLLLMAIGYWYQRRKSALGFNYHPCGPDQTKALIGAATVDEELTVLNRSPENHNLHREHQEVADKLLKSLTLGNLIGRGGFGQVYKATWNGAIVAVKVIFHRENVVSADEDVAREAALSSDLRHPNVVQTFMQATRVVTETSDKASTTQSNLAEDAQYVGIHNLYSGSDKENNCGGGEYSSLQHKETWLVQEFCDLGSLGHSLQLKLLDKGGEFDMQAVLHTCLDISRGMEYLHDRNVIHGDLKCTNVLLCSSTQSQRGFVAKVADFGLSRQLAVNVTHISTNTVGTLTHMPPELLKGRKLVPKADVYSFGIMMWEILMGRSPFSGWTAPQLLRAVLNEKWRPTFPDNAPRAFNELGMQCLKEEPQYRPEFSEITKRLDQLRVLYAPP